MSADLCYLSATEALARFAQGTLSPVDILQAQIAQHQRVNPSVNAIVMDYFDEALVQARHAEQAYRNGTNRPLEGITVAVKDEHNIAGKRTTQGSLLLVDNVPTYTDPICERLIAAGAIIHARTATPEFSSNYCTWSKLYGVTRTPWNLDYSAGGSSGGSGAALAAGMTTLATGSDIGGSIRAPAAQNAIVGYKPPHGRVPKAAPSNLIHYYTDGPMARTVDDVVLMENIIAGPHRGDINSLKPKVVLPTTYPDVNGMRIALCVTMGGKPVDQDVRRNTIAMAECFRSLGAIVNEVEIGWDESADANRAYNTYLFYLAIGMMEAGIGKHPDFDAQATSYVKWLVERGRELTKDDFISTLPVESFLYDCIQTIFDTHDLLICPTMSLASVKADFDFSRDTLIVDGREDPTVPGPGMTGYFNVLSSLPVISVPSGFDRNGVPTGLQIVGPAFEEAPVFRAARALEQARPQPFSSGHRPPL